METQYNKNITERLKAMPKFYLGQSVTTIDGEGIIVDLSMDWNGLYINEETAKAVVWYSTTEAQNGWVSKEYRISELTSK